jgi:hypothetical protein
MSQEASPNNFIFSECVREIRSWEDENLPLSQSRIAFDLFMLIGHSSELSDPMTLKEIFNTLKYSERGTRYVLNHFIDGRWCEIVGHDQDKRFRLVVPTQQLLDKLAEYRHQVLSKYESSHLAVNRS